MNHHQRRQFQERVLVEANLPKTRIGSRQADDTDVQRCQARGRVSRTQENKVNPRVSFWRAEKSLSTLLCIGILRSSPPLHQPIIPERNSTRQLTSMKLTSIILVASSFLAVSAFGVSPKTNGLSKTGSSAAVQPTTTFRKNVAVNSPLFRDPTVVRGGAVPGWAAYNDALDKKPLITKAMTSLVGWALGDLLAQVCPMECRVVSSHAMSGQCVRPLNSIHSTHTLPSSFTDLHQWRTLRHEAIHHSLGLWFHLPRTFGTLLLQLARLQD